MQTNRKFGATLTTTLKKTKMKHMLRSGIFACFVLVYTIPVIAQVPDSIKNYIDSAIYFMQSKSLYGKDLSWDKIRDSAYLKAGKARSYKEAFPAIAYAFQQLKDYHGMVANEDTFYRYPPPIDFEAVLSKGIKKEFLKGSKIVTAWLGNDIAYLRVPSMNVVNQKDIDKRANMLRDSLCSILAKKPGKLIVDLRMNTGGNIAPMITGLSPLLSDTILGYGVDRDGVFSAPTKIRNGVAIDDDGNKLVNMNNSCPKQTTIPIAVLIGPSTVSSGEILTVYLKQQKNVKLFGEPTPGFCNATEGFLFMNNQGYLLLSVNKIADAKKHVYTAMLVQPDTYVKSNDDYENLLSDPTVLAATSWLESK